MPLTYDTINTALIPSLEGVVWDMVYLADAFTARLRQKAKPEAYGKWREFALRTAFQDLGGAYTGYVTASMSQTESLTKARFTDKGYWEPFLVTLDDEIYSASPKAILSLVTERIAGATLRQKTRLKTDVWGSCIATGAESARLCGLTDMLKAADMATGVGYGGILVADLPTWIAVVKTSASAGYAGGKLTPHKIRKFFRELEGGPDAEAGKDGVTLCVTTKAIFSKIQAWTADRQRFTVAGKVGNYSFPLIQFEGVDVIWSENCPTGWFCGFNENYMGLKPQPGRDFKTTSLEKVPNGTGSVGQVLFNGILWCSKRNKQGVIQDIDADA